MPGETLSQSDELAECQICHLRTRYAQLLTPITRDRLNGHSQTILACPACISRKRFRSAILSMVLGLIIAFLFTICLVANRHERFDNMAYFSVSLVFSPAIIIFLHELGHALGGKCAGLEFFGITIGSGPLLFRWYIRGIYFDLHSYPAGGACWTYPSPDRVQRWRLMVMVAAGPISTGLLLLAAIYMATDHFSVQPRYLHLTGWLGFAFSAAVVFTYSVWPHTIQRDGTKIANDAKLILNFIKTPPNRDSYTLGFLQLNIAKCLRLRQLDEVRDWLDQLKKISGDSIQCSVSEFKALAMEGQWSSIWPDAKNRMQTATAETDRETFAAWAAVAMVYDNQDLNEAQLLAEDAMSLWPWDGTTQSIRALVLLAQGHIEESVLILENLNFNSLTTPAQAGVARMWIEIFERKQIPAQAHKWRRRAERLDPLKAYQLHPHTGLLASASSDPSTPNKPITH